MSNGSWWGDCAVFPNTTDPFFGRGGYYSYGSLSGVFYFTDDDGDWASGMSFRPALVVQTRHSGGAIN